MQDKLDRLLAAHCAPALAGVKPANLVACQRAEIPDLPRRLAHYRKAFAPRGICFTIVCACRERFLLLVYRRAQLEQQLRQPQVQQSLAQFGYAPEQTLDDMLLRLAQRLAAHDGFPHEIGLFLGYPLEDVRGFIEYGGRDYKLSGYWKVYGDVAAAQALFDRLTRVCRAVTRRVEQGESLVSVFAAA